MSCVVRDRGGKEATMTTEIEGRVPIWICKSDNPAVALATFKLHQLSVK